MKDNNVDTSKPYTVIARKWRPATFDDVVGQSHIVRTLKNSITMNRVAHAYLFSGPRGIGKTSIARIFAMALNCVEGSTTNPCGVCDSCQKIFIGGDIDCIEIDGASNRGIDEIRSLKERVMLVPSRGRYKIYIIDEVHMLTREAFNALLKTLEEPPSHVIFIFATTEQHKVPDTIVSRCQHFAFHRISVDDITERLKRIADEEEISITDDAINFISRGSEGALRDAQSLLEKSIAFSDEEITIDVIEELLNVVNTSTVIDLVELIIQGETEKAIRFIDDLNKSGVDINTIFDSLVDILYNSLLIYIGIMDGDVLNLASDDIERLDGVINEIEIADLYAITDSIIQAKSRYMRNTSPLLALELAIIRATKLVLALPVEDIISGIDSGRLMTNKSSDKKKDDEDIKKSTSVIDKKKVSDGGDWERIHGIIKNEKASLGGILNSARCINFCSEEIVLAFPESCSFHRDQLSQPENIRFIIDIVKRELGLKPKVVITELEGDEGNGGEDVLGYNKIREENKKIRENELQKDEEELIEVDDEKVRDVLNMFGARVVEVKDYKKD